MIATVDWDALLTVVWSSLLGGVGATAAYGLALLGSFRAVERGREGRSAPASGYALVGLLAAAAVVAAIVFGIVIVTDK